MARCPNDARAAALILRREIFHDLGAAPAGTRRVAAVGKSPILLTFLPVRLRLWVLSLGAQPTPRRRGMALAFIGIVTVYTVFSITTPAPAAHCGA
jgi:hypothetical protein